MFLIETVCAQAVYASNSVLLTGLADLEFRAGSIAVIAFAFFTQSEGIRSLRGKLCFLSLQILLR